ncbi:MAG: alpha/beta hydrolase [Polyangiaceae bacterium]
MTSSSASAARPLPSTPAPSARVAALGDALSPGDFARAFRATPHRRVDIGHSRMAYWKFGQGPDLVLVHGWPLDSATFRNILPRLSQQFTCHLFDLPGVGQSVALPSAPTDFVSHATSLRAAIDAIGLDRYALLAHDSGGFVARLLAAGDERVTRMVLGDTEIPGHTPPLIMAMAVLARMPFGAAVLRVMLGNRTLRRSALCFGGAFTDASFVDGPFFDLFVRPLIEDEAAARAQLAPLRTLHAGTMAALVTAHPQITVPVLMIWGTEDPFFPVDLARKMTTQLGGPVTFATIEGAKVFPHEDRADEFVDRALAFLA